MIKMRETLKRCRIQIIFLSVSMLCLAGVIFLLNPRESPPRPITPEELYSNRFSMNALNGLEDLKKLDVIIRGIDASKIQLSGLNYVGLAFPTEYSTYKLSPTYLADEVVYEYYENHSSEYVPLKNDILAANATVLFTLIDDLAEVNFCINGDSSSFSRTYTRDMFDHLFGADIAAAAADEQTFLGFMSSLYTDYFSGASYFPGANRYEPKRKLAMSDLDRLATKGEQLSWSDFTEFEGVMSLSTGEQAMFYPINEAALLGDGIWANRRIMWYPINVNYSVYIGGAPKEAPWYIFLYHHNERSYIDLRGKDIETFLRMTKPKNTMSSTTGLAGLKWKHRKAYQNCLHYLERENRDIDTSKVSVLPLAENDKDRAVLFSGDSGQYFLGHPEEHWIFEIGNFDFENSQCIILICNSETNELIGMMP